MAIEPYTISVAEDKIRRLRQKLEVCDLPDELDQASWDYGVPLQEVKRLTAAWKEFDWRRQEAILNQLPNYKVAIQVDGFEPLDIHFVHQKSKVDGAIPLLFSHGWPGSFIEVTKILPLIDKFDGQSAPAFHIVAPSLPNFGFSTGTRKRGFGLAQYAETCHRLMLKLGYSKYVTQGGDWGTMVTRIMGLRFPEHVCASHINMVRGHRPAFSSHPLLYLQHLVSPYSARDQAGRERSTWMLREGSGYRHQQSTKPQTLGYALTDSPVGLLAWILEKLRDWTDNYPWTDDEILTWVSIYHFSTPGPAASLRIYYESLHDRSGYGRDRTEQWIPTVPLGLAYFPRELTVVPKTWGRTLGPVVFESTNDTGGHFAAWERPGAIVDDLCRMFGRGGGAFGVVKGLDGYKRSVAKL